MINAIESSSARPYLIRALYEWCTDNGLTPYVAVRVDESVQVPREHVMNGEIVLNISYDATSSLKLGNEFIEFKARFAGKPREIIIPMDHVIAIYARENGQGMAFPPVVADPDARPSRTPSKSPEAVNPFALHNPFAETSQTHAPHALSKASEREKIVRLLSEDKPGTKPTNPDEPPPPKSPEGSGGRPMLKRIK